MKKTSISEITTSNIRSGRLEELIPEFYELKGVIENSAFHSNDPVFDHTLNVLKNMENLLKNAKGKLARYMNKKIAGHSRKELLFLAMVFHDIGKKETIVKKGPETACPGHEKEGAEKAEKILARFDLSRKEIRYVTMLIKNHGLIHLVMDGKRILAAEEMGKLRKSRRKIFPELLLMTMADTLGSHMGRNAPEELGFRMNLYRDFLDQ